MSKDVKELKFAIQLLGTVRIEGQLPIQIHVNNVGAIWLANNSSSGEQTCHVEITAHFIKGIVFPSVSEVVFKMSAQTTRTHIQKTSKCSIIAKYVWTIEDLNEG